MIELIRWYDPCTDIAKQPFFCFVTSFCLADLDGTVFQRRCFGLLIHASEGSITAWSTIAPVWCIWMGAVFIAVGMYINVAACRVIGIDTYFYKDLFLGRPVGDFKVEGPYKYLRNPMYGVGQLSAYGAALMAGSTIGLLATLLNQVIMFVFYYRVEKPHIESLF